MRTGEEGRKGWRIEVWKEACKMRREEIGMEYRPWHKSGVLARDCKINSTDLALDILYNTSDKREEKHVKERCGAALRRVVAGNASWRGTRFGDEKRSKLAICFVKARANSTS
jgi:hypothetical protein